MFSGGEGANLHLLGRTELYIQSTDEKARRISVESHGAMGHENGEMEVASPCTRQKCNEALGAGGAT